MSKWKNVFICPACGQPNEGDLSFCEFCGENLKPKAEREKGRRSSGGILPVFACVAMVVFILICLLNRIG